MARRTGQKINHDILSKDDIAFLRKARARATYLQETTDKAFKNQLAVLFGAPIQPSAIQTRAQRNQEMARARKIMGTKNNKKKLPKIREKVVALNKEMWIKTNRDMAKDWNAFVAQRAGGRQQINMTRLNRALRQARLIDDKVWAKLMGSEMGNFFMEYYNRSFSTMDVEGYISRVEEFMEKGLELTNGKEK